MKRDTKALRSAGWKRESEEDGTLELTSRETTSNKQTGVERTDCGGCEARGLERDVTGNIAEEASR